MAAVRHLEFPKLPFWSRDMRVRAILPLSVKFRISRTISRGDLAK